MMGGTYAPNSIEGSSSIYSTDLRDHFQYVAPSDTTQGIIFSKSKKKSGIQSYFTSSSSANASQLPQTHVQPTLDDHWKKKYKEAAYEYIARWWYDANLPFNAACSSYYQPMWDAVIAVGKGFKGPSMHDLRESLLQNKGNT